MARSPVMLEPQARVVDTFVQPAKSELWGLAEGLSNFDSGLKAYVNMKSSEEAINQKALGEQQFHKDNAVGYAEAVKTGKIPSFASKSFVDGYRTTEGTVLGYNMQQDFNHAWDTWEGKDSEDPEAYNNFAKDFFAQRMKETVDPATWAGLKPHVQAITETGANRWIEYRHDKTYKGNITATVAQVNQEFEADDNAALENGTEVNWDKKWAQIAKLRAEKSGEGVRTEDFDKSMMSAVALSAIEKREPKYLSFFSQKVPGQSYTYGETPEGAKLLAETRSTLQTIGRQRESDEYTRETRADKKAEEANTRAAIELLAANPNAPLPDALMVDGVKHDPKFRINIAEWQSSLTKGHSDPEKLLAVTREVMNGGGVKAVQNAMQQGVFGRPEDLKSAYEFAKSFEGSTDKINEVMSLPSAKAIIATIKTRTDDQSFINPVEGLTNEGLEASYDFRMAVMDYVVKNPDASAMEREKAIAEISKSVLGRMTEGSATGGTSATYDSPDKGNPFKGEAGEGKEPGTQPPATPVAPGQKKAATDAPRPTTAASDVDDMSFYTTLPRVVRTQIEDRAEKSGIPLSEAIKGFRAKAEGRPAAPAPLVPERPELDPTSFTEQDALDMMDGAADAGFDVNEAVKYLGSNTGDLSADAILKGLISPHEAGGNYNAYFGNSKSREDLGKYSLDQIIGLQAERLQSGKVRSTATGAYQFMRRTLKDLKKELGLNGTERFTPELQDQLGMALLKRRGYDDWKAGRIKTREFARNLAQEWAALPDPKTGRSYYAGDGLNKSTTRTNTVLNALDTAKDI